MTDTETVETIEEIKQKALRLLVRKGDVERLSKDFAGLKTNSERVFFAHKILEDNNLFPNFTEDCKNNDQAIKCRQFGNEMFKKKKALEAIEFYTKSIALAEKNSENLALCYANRSAVLFEKKLYTECLRDIERAFKNNYPKNLAEKLLKRQENANKFRLLTSQEPYYEDPPIIPEKERSKVFQCAADCVRMEETDELGRHIIATKDIQVGDVIAVEKAYCAILLEKRLIHCHHCLVLCYNTIPCDGCTQAVYCGEKCKKNAWKEYHKYECSILKMAYMLKIESKLLGLKIALSIRHLYQEIANQNLEDSLPYRSDRYTEVHNLITNTEKRKPADLFARAVSAATLYNLVKKHTKFFEDLGNMEEIFCELVLRHNQTSASNFHEITEIAEASNNIYSPSEIGAGVYPFISLINHSCSPNVLRICHGTTLQLLAIQNIKEGEQLFDNYGYHYAVMDKKERQDHLRSQYCFICRCPPCIEEWPFYRSLPHDGNMTVSIDDDDFYKLTRADTETARRLLKEYLPQARKNWKNPCKERSDIEEIVKQCYAILANRRKTL